VCGTSRKRGVAGRQIFARGAFAWVASLQLANLSKGPAKTLRLHGAFAWVASLQSVTPLVALVTYLISLLCPRPRPPASVESLEQLDLHWRTTGSRTLVHDPTCEPF